MRARTGSVSAFSLLGLTGVLSLTACRSNVRERGNVVTRQALVATFRDVPANHPNAEAIRFVTSRHIIEPDSPDQFGAARGMTRGEILQILMDIAGIAPVSSVTVNPFPDIDRLHRLAGYIARAQELHIVRGRDNGRFEEQRIVSIVEALKMMLLTNGIDIYHQLDGSNYADVPSGSWYEGLGRYTLRNRLIDPTPDGRMDRDHQMLKAEVAQLFYRFFSQHPGCLRVRNTR